MKDLIYFLALAREDRFRLALGAVFAMLAALAGLALFSLAGWVSAAAAAGAGLAFGALIGGGGLAHPRPDASGAALSRAPRQP